MNPYIIDILRYLLENKFKVLVLSNGMRPIEIKFKKLLALPNLNNLTIRISVDHFKKKRFMKALEVVTHGKKLLKT